MCIQIVHHNIFINFTNYKDMLIEYFKFFSQLKQIKLIFVLINSYTQKVLH